MNTFANIAQYIQKLFTWWVVVMPFEQAIRIRFGKHTKILSAGTWLKIPFFDAVYVQNTRLNAVTVPTQTVTTKDGKTITVSSCVMFRICNIEKLYTSLNHPERTLISIVMSEVSDFISRSISQDCLPPSIEKYLIDKIDSENFGLDDVQLRITGYAVVKTFRILRDSDTYISSSIDMDKKREPQQL